jgi:succinyl-CoA synthetase alpha subunit
MDNSIFLGKRVVIQGISGKQGRFHTERMVEYGTPIIAGTSQSKAGTRVCGIPVFASLDDIKQQLSISIDISVIFVPAATAKAAIMEAIRAQVPLIVCITEHIPVHDMLYIRQQLANSQSVLIGPNSPGVLVPEKQLLGIIPGRFSTIGTTAVVSRSGTLTYEAMSLLTGAGFGQKYIIGIGGDMIHGSSFVDCLELFEYDDGVERIVLIGEVGGTAEITAADYIASSMSKPVYAYIAGQCAPPGVQLGHAGAILGTDALESAQAKTAYLDRSGAVTAPNLSQLISMMK